MSRLFLSSLAFAYAWPDSSVQQLPMNGSRPSDIVAINATFADKDGYGTDGKLARFTYDGLAVWSVDINGPYLHDPVFAPDGTVYLWTDHGESLRAFGADGGVKWKMVTSRSIDSDKKHAPVVGPDGTVYVVTCFGSNYEPELVALNSFNGRKLWSYALPRDAWAIPVIAADGTIMLNADGRLRGIKPDDGTEAWSFNVTASDSSEPAAGPDGTVYICSERSVLAIDPTREPVPSQDIMIMWKFSFFARGPSCSSKIWGTKPPVVDENGDVYWMGATGSEWTDRLHKFGPGGEIVWVAETTKFGRDVVGNLSGPLPDAPFIPVVGGSATKPFILVSYYYEGAADRIQLLAVNGTDGSLLWHSNRDLRSKPSAAGSRFVAYFERPNVELGQVTGFTGVLSGFVPKFEVREQWFYPSPRSDSCPNDPDAWALCKEADDASGIATDCNSRDACIWSAYDKACVRCEYMVSQCTVEDEHRCAGREQSSCDSDSKCFWGRANVMTCIPKCSPTYTPSDISIV